MRTESYVVLYVPKGQRVSGPATPGLQIRGPYDLATARKLAEHENTRARQGLSSLQAIVRPHQDGQLRWPIGTGAAGLVGVNRAGPVPAGGSGALIVIPLIAVVGIGWLLWQLARLPTRLARTYQLSLELKGVWYGEKFHHLWPWWPYPPWRVQWRVKLPVVRLERRWQPPPMTLRELLESRGLVASTPEDG